MKEFEERLGENTKKKRNVKIKVRKKEKKGEKIMWCERKCIVRGLSQRKAHKN